MYLVYLKCEFFTARSMSVTDVFFVFVFSYSKVLTCKEEKVKFLFSMCAFNVLSYVTISDVFQKVFQIIVSAQLNTIPIPASI